VPGFCAQPASTPTMIAAPSNTGLHPDNVWISLKRFPRRNGFAASLPT